MTPVRLPGLPVEVHRRAVEHHEVLRREYAGVEQVGAEDWEAAEVYAVVLGNVDEVGSVVVVDERVRTEADRLADAIDALEQRCRVSGIPGAVAAADVHRYRRWMLGQIVEQSAGRPPQRYDGPAPEDEVRGAIVIGGDLDVFAAETFRQRIDERLDAGEVSIEVDLSGCTFIDSAGLTLLLTARERCRTLGGELRVVAATEEIVRLFETVGVAQLLLGS